MELLVNLHTLFFLTMQTPYVEQVISHLKISTPVEFLVWARTSVLYKYIVDEWLGSSLQYPFRSLAHLNPKHNT